jgi:glutamate synthase (NADPH/NADH) large chain
VAALDRLCGEVEAAVREGVNILILSDRGVTPELAPIPMLLATGAVHHHLIRNTLRTRCGIVCESAEPREVAQMALLIGYGAAAVNPYLALSTIEELVEEGTYLPESLSVEAAHSNFVKANDKGCFRPSRRWASPRCSLSWGPDLRAIGLDASSSRAASRARRRASPGSAST